MILSTWNFEYAFQLQSTKAICFRRKTKWFRNVRHPMRLLMIFAIQESIFQWPVQFRLIKTS